MKFKTKNKKLSWINGEFPINQKKNKPANLKIVIGRKHTA